MHKVLACFFASIPLLVLLHFLFTFYLLLNLNLKFCRTRLVFFHIFEFWLALVSLVLVNADFWLCKIFHLLELLLNYNNALFLHILLVDSMLQSCFKLGSLVLITIFVTRSTNSSAERQVLFLKCAVILSLLLLKTLLFQQAFSFFLDCSCYLSATSFDKFFFGDCQALLRDSDRLTSATYIDFTLWR